MTQKIIVTCTVTICTLPCQILNLCVESQITAMIPSGYVKIAIENGPVEIVDLPMKNGDFP